MSPYKTNTVFAKDIKLTEAKRQYDREAKNLLSYRFIVDFFLKYCTDEFAGYSLGEINRLLGGEGTELLGDGKIKLMNNKDNLPGVVPIEFDLRFNVETPHGQKLQLDIEPQKALLPEKLLKNRGCYYCSRMITAQSNTVFQKDHYQEMQKVYSIWIIPDAGSRENTIEEYVLQNKNNKDDVLQVMKLIYLYLGNPYQEGIPEILQLLDVIFSATMTIEEIITVLEDVFHVKMTVEVKEVMTKMCNFSDVILARGEARGEARGAVRGEEKTMRMVAFNLKAMHTPVEVIAKVLETTVEKVKELLEVKA